VESSDNNEEPGLVTPKDEEVRLEISEDVSSLRYVSRHSDGPRSRFDTSILLVCIRKDERLPPESYEPLSPGPAS
jgi:hypothetical protein